MKGNENQFDATKMLIDGAVNLISKQPEQAFFAMQFAALGSKSPRALYLLGRMFIDGIGTEPDVPQGISKIEESAGSGYADAEYFLAAMYYWGKHVPIDYEKAFKYASLAADHGNADAMNMLCDCYVHGHGVEQDSAKGVEWLLKYSQATQTNGLPVEEEIISDDSLLDE